MDTKRAVRKSDSGRDKQKCVLIKFSSMLIHLGLVRRSQPDNPGRNLAAATTRKPLIDFGAAALF